MKKILFTLFLFLAFCIPSFANQSISVSDISINEAKKIITVYMTENGWAFKNETDYLLSFEKTGRTYVGPSATEMNEYRYMLEHSEQPIYYKEPEGHYETYTNYSQFIFNEKDNYITINTSSEDVLKVLFTGYYTYNINYDFPLFFYKSSIYVTDTPQTIYAGKNKIVDSTKITKVKITKINDKRVKDYSYENEEIKKLFKDCPVEKLKLESDKGKTYYILRTFVEPTYKQYL